MEKSKSNDKDVEENMELEKQTEDLRKNPDKAYIAVGCIVERGGLKFEVVAINGGSVVILNSQVLRDGDKKYTFILKKVGSKETETITMELKIFRIIYTLESFRNAVGKYYFSDHPEFSRQFNLIF